MRGTGRSGREVLIADPGYPCNRHFVRLMEGARSRRRGCRERLPAYSGRCSKAVGASATIAALVSTPSNPTGTLVSTERPVGDGRVRQGNGGKLIVDEIYHGLVYEGDYTTALAFTDDVFVVNSFSKYFNMTGWRLGWLVAPQRFLPELDKLAQNIYLAPPTLAQHAALAAFEPATIAILEARREEFRARRDFLVPALRRSARLPCAPWRLLSTRVRAAHPGQFRPRPRPPGKGGRGDHAGVAFGRTPGAARALCVHQLDRSASEGVRRIAGGSPGPLRIPWRRCSRLGCLIDIDSIGLHAGLCTRIVTRGGQGAVSLDHFYDVHDRDIERRGVLLLPSCAGR